MRVKQQDWGRIWQTMRAILYSNKQQRTEKYGDREMMSETCCIAWATDEDETYIFRVDDAT